MQTYFSANPIPRGQNVQITIRLTRDYTSLMDDDMHGVLKYLKGRAIPHLTSPNISHNWYCLVIRGTVVSPTLGQAHIDLPIRLQIVNITATHITIKPEMAVAEINLPGVQMALESSYALGTIPSHAPIVTPQTIHHADATRDLILNLPPYLRDGPASNIVAFYDALHNVTPTMKQQALDAKFPQASPHWQNWRDPSNAEKLQLQITYDRFKSLSGKKHHAKWEPYCTTVLPLKNFHELSFGTQQIPPPDLDTSAAAQRARALSWRSFQ